MAIIIDHRFLNRLLPTNNRPTKILIIGTFNPGVPDKTKLDETEMIQFAEIESSDKFKKFNEVKNFYDRPQNRFWKILDYFHDKSFYQQNALETKNPNGLKFYKKHGLTREVVFKRQQDHCDKNGIFITDIVTRLRPVSFCDIYDNFPDSAIEKSDCDWNTEGIINSFASNRPERIIVNFKINERQIPRISNEINKIKKALGDKVVSVYSTSGAAGYKYSELVDNWGQYL